MRVAVSRLSDTLIIVSFHTLEANHGAVAIDTATKTVEKIASSSHKTGTHQSATGLRILRQCNAAPTIGSEDVQPSATIRGRKAVAVDTELYHSRQITGKFTNRANNLP